MDISALQNGDASAWRDFVEGFAPLVLSIVRRTFAKYGRTGAEEEIEDISQDVFVKLSRNRCDLLKRFDPARAKLSTFVGVVTRSTAIDALRRLKPVAEDIDDHADHLAAPGQAQGGDSASNMLASLPSGLLSDKQEMILSLLFDADLDPEEVAGRLGVEVQTIRSAKHKALTKIRNHLSSLEEHERPF